MLKSLGTQSLLSAGDWMSYQSQCDSKDLEGSWRVTGVQFLLENWKILI